MRAYHGSIFRLTEHLKRLSESCGAMGRALPVEAKELRRWLVVSLKESGFADATLRLSLHWPVRGEGEWVLFVRPFKSHPEEWYRRGVTLRCAAACRPSPRAQDPQIKASQYVSGVLATLDSVSVPQADAHELLFFGPSGTIAEGTVSNIFIFKQKCLLTPSAGSGILKGVTRAFVMELARRRKWPIREVPLTRHDLYTSDECFMTNTSSEVLPVVAIDGRVIGGGRPGPLTLRLREDFIRSR